MWMTPLVGIHVRGGSQQLGRQTTHSANINHESLQPPQDLLNGPTCKVAQVETMEAVHGLSKGMLLINHDLDIATSIGEASAEPHVWPHFLERPASHLAIGRVREEAVNSPWCNKLHILDTDWLSLPVSICLCH